MQITPSNLAFIYYGLKAGFDKAYEQTNPWSQLVAWEAASNTSENRYNWLKLIPRLREWIGERKVNNLSARGYSLINKDYEDTLGIDRNNIEDDQMGVYSNAIQMLGEAAKRWPDDLVSALILAGTSALCYDGQAFFSGSHPVDTDNAAAGTFSNNFTGTALTAANLLAVCASMESYVGEDGKPLRVTPDTIMVPPQLKGTAKSLVETDILVAAFGGNSAAGGASNFMKGMAKVLVVPELSGAATTWYLMDCSKPIKPFVFQKRKAPVFAQLTDPTSENVFMRKEYLYGVDARGNAGYTLPFLAARCIA